MNPLEGHLGNLLAQIQDIAKWAYTKETRDWQIINRDLLGDKGGLSNKLKVSRDKLITADASLESSGLLSSGSAKSPFGVIMAPISKEGQTALLKARVLSVAIPIFQLLKKSSRLSETLIRSRRSELVKLLGDPQKKDSLYHEFPKALIEEIESLKGKTS